MTAVARPRPRPRPPLSPASAVLLGGLTIALLDIADAIVYYGLKGATPIRIFQSIARGLLGRAAFDGGLPTALLGALLHTFISVMIALVFYVAATRLPVLVRQPWRWGALYGVGVYLVMYLIVLPLSRVGLPPFRAPDVLDEILIHVFGVGIPAALFARAAGIPRTVTGFG